jgi:hypothetical protein
MEDDLIFTKISSSKVKIKKNYYNLLRFKQCCGSGSDRMRNFGLVVSGAKIIISNPVPEFIDPCGGLHLVINTYFISYMCLANYGASEAVYPCVVVEKIHESF